MADKVKGTVKWFSNRKGFGFITPISDIDSESDIAPTEDDIFVHQSGIVMETKESYRTLKDGLEVAYDVITDDNGKLKAVNVTSADGSPCPPPEPRERRRRKKKPSTDSGDADADSSDKEEDETGEEKPKEKKGRKKNDKKTEPSWDTDLEETVKEGLESRNIKIVAGKTFLAIGDARLKLGSGG
jgi:CspA family cold shock protein